MTPVTFQARLASERSFAYIGSNELSETVDTTANAQFLSLAQAYSMASLSKSFSVDKHFSPVTIAPQNCDVTGRIEWLNDLRDHEVLDLSMISTWSLGLVIHRGECHNILLFENTRLTSTT